MDVSLCRAGLVYVPRANTVQQPAFALHGGSSGGALNPNTYMYWPDIGVTATTVCINPDIDYLATGYCPPLTVITSIDFVSIGRPTGSCGSFAANPLCQSNPTKAMNLVTKWCLGQTICSIQASTSNNVSLCLTCTFIPLTDDPSRAAPSACFCCRTSW